jgi:L,D-transpeptidase YcbB
LLPDSVVRAKICSTLVLLTRAPWHRDSVCVRVNIPEFTLDYLDDGERVRHHRVVVGRDTVGLFTPVFSSQLKHVVLNPQWHVPARILRNEIMAGKVLDAKALRDQGYEPKFDAKGKVTGAFQPSGDDNALGKVKFLFDNRYGVYLHDTPSRYLFARRTRAYSHGCVRLEDPLGFAAFLLERDGHRRAGDVDSLVAEEDQKWLKLARPVPIHLEYRLVTLDSQGRVRFLRDLYALARARAKAEKERLKLEAKRLAQQQVVDRKP